jgi:hypothetical protein
MERWVETTPRSKQRAKTNQPLQWLLLLLSIYSTSVLYGLDVTIVADIQAPVIEDFGQEQKLGWIGIGFPLGSVAIILVVSVVVPALWSRNHG